MNTSRIPPRPLTGTTLTPSTDNLVGEGYNVVKYKDNDPNHKKFNEGAMCLYTPWLFQPDAHEQEIEGSSKYPDEWLDPDTGEPLDLSGLNITFDDETYNNLLDLYWGPPNTAGSTTVQCGGEFTTDNGCWPKNMDTVYNEGTCGEGGAGCIWFHRGADGNGGNTIFETVQKAQDGGAKAVIYSLSNPRYNTIKEYGNYPKPYFEDDEFAYGGDIELRDVEVDGFQSALHPTIPVCFISRDIGNDIANIMVKGYTLQTLHLRYKITSWWKMYISGGFFGYVEPLSVDRHALCAACPAFTGCTMPATLYCVSLRVTACHCVSLRRYVSLRVTTCHYVSLRVTTCRYVSLRVTHHRRRHHARPPDQILRLLHGPLLRFGMLLCVLDVRLVQGRQRSQRARLPSDVYFLCEHHPRNLLRMRPARHLHEL